MGHDISVIRALLRFMFASVGWNLAWNAHHGTLEDTKGGRWSITVTKCE